MCAARHPTRRGLIAGSASALAVGALAGSRPAVAWQSTRELLDLLLAQERAQIAHYTALLAAFDDAAFADAGLPDGVRESIEAVLSADETHLAALSDPAAPSPTTPAAPAPTDLIVALREAAELENFAVAVYALAIPLLRRERLIPQVLGIHSVDARHAAWLATILGNNPFPNAIDPPLTLDESRPDDAEPPEGPQLATPVPNGDVASALAAIARELGVSEGDLVVVEVTAEDWPDTSLGCPQPDVLYAQVITPGFRILVDVDGERIEFHADRRGNVVRCP